MIIVLKNVKNNDFVDNVSDYYCEIDVDQYNVAIYNTNKDDTTDCLLMISLLCFNEVQKFHIDKKYKCV